MQLWIHNSTGAINAGDQQPGERLATPEEIEVIINGPTPTIEEARAAKIAEINAGYDSVMGYVQSGYPDREVLSWERQASQARAYRDDPALDIATRAAFVAALAKTKGLTLEEMCRRILRNAESWEPVAAMLTGQRQLMEEAAWAAETTEQVSAIKVGYTV